MKGVPLEEAVTATREIAHLREKCKAFVEQDDERMHNIGIILQDCCVDAVGTMNKLRKAAPDGTVTPEDYAKIDSLIDIMNALTLCLRMADGGTPLDQKVSFGKTFVEAYATVLSIRYYSTCPVVEDESILRALDKVLAESKGATKQ